MAANACGLKDEDGGHPDWIELHNPSNESVNIAGWTLTDDASFPGKWFLPETEIPGGGYLVVFASGKDRRRCSVPPHTNFRLSRGGEYLGLFAPGPPRREVSAFAPAFPEQREDVAYGLAADGKRAYLRPPTPGASNESAQVLGGFCGLPGMYPPRGFYEEGFLLEIRSPTPGATVRYTLDGSSPSESHGTEYAGPFRVEGDAVVRAVAYRDDALLSPVSTHTYLVGADAAIASLPVLSLVGDAEETFYEPHGIMAIVGGRYEDGRWLPEKPGDYNHPMRRGREYERPASVEWVRSDGTAGFQIDAGLRVHGSDYARPAYRRSDDWTQPEAKFSFRLYFREDYGQGLLEYPIFPAAPVDGFERLVLRAGDAASSPLLTDELVRRLHGDMGYDYAHGTFVNLFVNGVYKGCYNLTERIDEAFLRGRHGEESQWDIVTEDGVDAGDIDAWWRLMAQTRSLDLAHRADYAAVRGALDVDAFIDYVILQLYVANLDWPHSNWIMARDQSQQGPFRMLVWDAEMALSSRTPAEANAFGDLPGQVAVRTGMNRPSCPLAVFYLELKKSPAFRKRFAERAQQHLCPEGALGAANVKARFEALRRELQHAVPGMDTYIRDVWAEARGPAFLGHLAEEGFIGPEPAKAEPGPPSPLGGPVINEVFPHSHGQDTDWVEIRNPWAVSLDLGGWFLSDNPEVPWKFEIPAATVMQPGGYLVLDEGLSFGNPHVTGAHVPFALSEYGETVLLSGPRQGPNRGTEIRGSYAAAERGMVWGRPRDNADGVGLMPLEHATPGRLNPGEFVPFLAINEIHYHPVAGDTGDEYLELINTNQQEPIQIDKNRSAALAFVNGLSFEFPPTLEISPGGLLLVAKEPEQLMRAYPGIAVPVLGPYGGRLSNQGERIALAKEDATDPAAPWIVLDEAVYDDAPPWPLAADGVGFALAKMEPDAPGNRPESWMALPPSPGQPNPVPRGPSNGGVLISEIMYHPASHRDAEEFVELHNAGEQDVRLHDWRLAGAVRYVFPDAAIEAGACLVVAADPAVFRAAYPAAEGVVGGWAGALSNRGETLELVDAEGRVVDRVAYADQGDWARRELGPEDHGHRGWGWVAEHDGLGKSLELLHPDLPNDIGQNWQASGADGVTLGTVLFAEAEIAPLIRNAAHAPAVPRSSEAVRVSVRVDELSEEEASVSLHFREDGAPEFETLPLRPESEDRFHAAAIPAKPDGTVVEFYIEARCGDGPARRWPATAPEANALYQVNDRVVSGRLATYLLVMRKKDWTALRVIGDGVGEDHLSNAQMNAAFVAVENGRTECRYEVGVRIRGHGNRIDPPNSYRVNFPRDRRWRGLGALNLNSHNTSSQLIGSALYREAGLPAARAWPVHLRVNGEDYAVMGPRMYGCYAALEPFNAEFAAEHFPGDSGGNLYRCREGSHLYFEGDDPDAYRDSYFKQTNASEDDWDDLVELVRTLDTGSSEALFSEVEKVVDLDAWLRYLAVDNLLGNMEAGLATGKGDDYALYRGQDDPRFVLIPHDLDELWGEKRSIFTYALVPGFRRLFDDPVFLRRFYETLEELADTIFYRDTLHPLLEDVLADCAPRRALDERKDYFERRRRNVLGQIPRAFGMARSFAVADGRYFHLEPDAAVRGVADVLSTRLVRMGDTPVYWYPRYGQWSASRLLVPTGALWYYRDTGEDLSAAQSAEDPGDVILGGPRGATPLGYGDKRVAHEIGYGLDPALKHVSTYFLHYFYVNDLSQLGGLELKLRCTGGAVVHLNGVEAARLRLSGGTGEPVAAGVTATAPGDFEEAVAFPVDAGSLRQGKNILTVAVHRFDLHGPKLLFDAELMERPSVRLVPGSNRLGAAAYDAAHESAAPIATDAVELYHGPPRGMAGRRVVLSARDSFLPGHPFPVRVSVEDAGGEIDRDLWEAVVQLRSSKGPVEPNEVRLMNGVGSALVHYDGTEDFTLTAVLGEASAEKGLSSAPEHSVREVSGALAEDALHWDGIVRVTGSVRIPESAVLSIAPGTLVLIESPFPGEMGHDIEVHGAVEALGTAERPITFMAAEAARPWGQIFHDHASASVYRWVQFVQGGNSPASGHTERGTALRVQASEVLFEDCLIADLYGKAMASAQGASVTLAGCVVSRCAMGPELLHTRVDIRDSWFTEMRDPDEGDGLYILTGPETARVARCVFAQGTDDAIDTWGAEVEVEDCILRGFADKGLSVDRGNVRLRGCLVVDTGVGVSAKARVGGPVRVSIEHCTFARQHMALWIRDLFRMPDVGIRFDVRNSIFQDNRILVHTDYEAENVLIAYSLLNQPWPGPGNVVERAGFAAPAQGDYGLRKDSPAIDAGDPDDAPDSDGSRADLGCFPSAWGQRRMWHVRPEVALPEAGGRSWDQALGSIQAAIDAAAAAGGGEVWVAGGRYTGEAAPIVALRAKVSVYGGFSGNEAKRAQRDPQAHPSVIDGQDSVCCVHGADAALLDGFTITGGRADGEMGGGGMQNHLASPRVVGCIFKNNAAGYAVGGGIYNGPQCRPEILRCRFVENSAWQGGAMFNGPTSAPRIVNCLFAGNTAEKEGGAIHSYAAAPQVLHCTLVGNREGALTCVDETQLSIRNSIVWGNGAGILASGGAEAAVFHSLVQGGPAEDTVVDADPLFEEEGSYRLSAASPCVDGGETLQGVEVDIEGRLRSAGHSPDLGAFESDHVSSVSVSVPEEVCALDSPSAVFLLLLAVADADGSGALDRIEFAGISLPEPPHPFRGDAWVLADVDGDGAVSAADWEGNALFHDIFPFDPDADKDGVLSPEESRGMGMEADAAADFVAVRDSDADGHIDCAELLEEWPEIPAAPPP